MLKLELPFHLTETADERPFWSGAGERRATMSEIILVGLTIAIETTGKTYEICSDEYPVSNTPSFGGTIWPRYLLPLPGEMSVEQQMLLPAEDDAVAISWRLIGRTLFPARLKVSPIFITRQPISVANFEIEPESNGGRLAWRPYHHSSRIIADTNGRFAGNTSPFLQSGVTPATFEFDLSSRPAVLIFSAEIHSPADANPLIGGFLAQLVEQRTAMSKYDYRRDLVAA